MVKVDGGTLQMPADDGGVRSVEVGDLWFSQTEVTWDLYDVWVYELDQSADEDVDGVSRPSKPYIPPDRGFGHSGHPAISMSRHASVEFCRWLSEKTDRRYRLPTREEWTHAALGGAEFTPADVDPQSVWCKANTHHKTEAVGQKEANGYGLYDMFGNVAEWVSDPSEKRPIAMGGSFMDAPEGCTPTSVKRQDSTWNMSDPQIPKSTWWLSDCGFVGIRLVCEGPIKTPRETGEEGKDR